MQFSDKTFDILNKLQRWLPSLGLAYLGFCKVWGLSYGTEINETLVIVATLLAATLEISSSEYNKDKLE